METPDTSDVAAVPRAFALMWGLDEAGSRGPKRGLSLTQVVDAAIEVADVEGAGALSMSRVAKHLGFTAMSLYRYVDSKDTLMELVSDRALGPPPDLLPGVSWRGDLEVWAWAVFRSMGAHPWLLDLPMVAPPIGPNNMAWLETGLSVLAGTSVPEAVKLQLVMNISLYIIGRMRFAKEMLASAESNDDYPDLLGRVIDPQRYPALTTALSHQGFDDMEMDTAESALRFGLDRMLDGYEQFVRSFEQ